MNAQVLYTPTINTVCVNRTWPLTIPVEIERKKKEKKERTEALQRPGLTSTRYTEQPCFYAPDTALECKNETQ